MSKFLKQKNSLLNLDGLVEISINKYNPEGYAYSSKIDTENPWRIRVELGTDDNPWILHRFETEYQCRKVYNRLCEFILDNDKLNRTIDLDKLIEETEEYGN